MDSRDHFARLHFGGNAPSVFDFDIVFALLRLYNCLLSFGLWIKSHGQDHVLCLFCRG